MHIRIAAVAFAAAVALIGSFAAGVLVAQGGFTGQPKIHSTMIEARRDGTSEPVRAIAVAPRRDAHAKEVPAKSVVPLEPAAPLAGAPPQPVAASSDKPDLQTNMAASAANRAARADLAEVAAGDGAQPGVVADADERPAARQAPRRRHRHARARSRSRLYARAYEPDYARQPMNPLDAIVGSLFQ